MCAAILYNNYGFLNGGHKTEESSMDGLRAFATRAPS